MINIVNKRARALYLAEMTRIMMVLENTQARQLKPILNKQYLNAASLVRQGVLDAVDHAVDQERKRLVALLSKNYRRIAVTFSNKAYKVIEDGKKFIIVPDIKGPKDEFWTELNRWMATEAATKVTKVQRTTRKLLAKTIQKGMEEGLSNYDIAKNLRKTGKISTPIRAKTIAITETHTAAVKSVDAAIRSTRIEMNKEWVATIDKRTRPDHVDADGKRVPEGSKFRVGGVSMEYPGDPAGGADQCVRCRCVLMYHTVKRMDKLKPYKPAPGFVPAKTIREAEKWATDNKLASKVNYKKLGNVDIANVTNKTLAALISETKVGYDEIQAINRKSGKWKGIPFTFEAKINPDKTIKSRRFFINQSYMSRYKDTESLIKDIKKTHKEKWWMAESIEDLITHEHGHNLTAYNIWLARKEKPILFDLENRAIFDYKKLGRYASTSFDETLAEIYAKSKKGEIVKKEWKSLFNKFSEAKIK